MPIAFPSPTRIPPRLAWLTASALSLSATLSAQAEELRVPLREHEQVVLQLPRAWTAEIRRPLPEVPPTIALTDPARAGFKVLITIGWPGPGRSGPSAPELRTWAEAAASRAALQSVESSLPVKDLSIPGRPGYYFSATDRAPKPGGYTYLSQGAMGYEDLRVGFTVLTNDQPEAVLEMVTIILRTLKRIPVTTAGKAPG